MREVPIDGRQVRIRATPVALLYYKQAFGVDLTSDLLRMRGMTEENLEAFDGCVVLQMAWAMAKADQGPGKSFPSFEGWLTGMESVDLGDLALAAGVMEEAADGFFRGTRPVPGAAPERRGPGRPTGPGVA